MEALPTSLLTQQAAARPKTSADLEVFGKAASTKYHSGECGSLTSAVVEVVKTAGLSPEQVRRVVEFANQNAYLSEFKKEGSHHKVVHFDEGPADPSAVLKDLNDGGGGSVFDPGNGDYSAPPTSMGKVAARNEARMGVETAKLASVFDPDGESAEVADVQYPYADPLREAYDTLGMMKGLEKEAEAQMHTELYKFQEVCNGLYHEVKQAALNGTPLSHIIAACQQGAPDADAELMKSAFQVFTPRLLQGGVFPSKTAIGESLTEKLGSAGARQVNPQHPLPNLYREFCESATKLAALEQARREAATAKGQLDTFLQEAVKQASTATAVGSFLGKTVPKAWRTARDVAARGGGQVADFTSAAVRSGGGSQAAADRAAQLLGGAVKYSPHAAAGLAAEEMYQQTKLHPAVQATKNFLLSRVPNTEQNMLRQARIYRG